MTSNDLPWIIFTLNGQRYALNSELVAGIIKMPAITPVPEVPDFFEGVSNIRGEVIPIADMRRLLKITDMQAEKEELCKMLEQRMQDHRNWLDELKRCVEEGKHFSLATDPTRCAFGKWYYSYTEKNEVMGMQLRQLEEPHKRFHENAMEILKNVDENGVISEEGKRLLQRQEQILANSILKTIREIIDHIRNEQSQMVITLSRTIGDPAPCMGIVVDGVDSVDRITLIDERENSRCLFVSHYVCGVAHNEKLPGEILTLDEERLLQLTNVFNEASEEAKKAH